MKWGDGASVTGRGVAAIVVSAVLAAGCAGGSSPPRRAAAVSTTTSTTLPPTTTTTAPVAPTTVSTTAPPVTAPLPSGVLTLGAAGAEARNAPSGTVIEHLRAGVVLPIQSVQGGWVRVQTPCDNQYWVRTSAGTTTRHATIVLDPGHGGAEPGAVGTAGLTEKDLNLAVAGKVADALRSQGIEVVVTHPQQYTATLAYRGAIAAALKPSAFISIHHNSSPDGPHQGPGSETYYQYHSPESKRLAGLMYEEVVRTLATFNASWVGDTDAGAKWRTGTSGNDYYAVLRIPGTAGITASLAELAFISNPSEEALLQRDDVRDQEAAAVARGIMRFLRSKDAGSGFTTPYPRTEPAGGGGGKAGCADPT